jgi:hypothetical protein
MNRKEERLAQLGLTVVGKINLSTKKNATNVAKKHFKFFSGGATLGEIFKAQNISLR